MTGKKITPTLTLLGGFAVAYNLTIALHEFGHMVAMLMGAF